MIRSTSTSPAPDAVRLGYLALLPFALGAVLVWFAPVEWSARAGAAMSAYAAVVMSFIGGIYWGLGFQQNDPQKALFVWGVLPSLVAASALMLPPAAALVVHSAMLVVCYLVDRKFYPANGIGVYLPLRLRLTFGAVIGCCAAAFGIGMV